MPFTAFNKTSFALAPVIACMLTATPAVARSMADPAPKIVFTSTVAGEVAELTLKNGLKVILKENHAAPVVTWVVIYKVGSRNESAGATGSAHLLEHMLFKGTKTLGKGQIAQLLDRNGADSNASTWTDWTNYYETYAADRLELGLKVEASRMRDALILDSERQSEMTVVRNELERGESSPNRVLYQHLVSTAYRSHPYHHPTIGWRADVEGVATSTLKRFYNTFYQPNNAVAVLVGDFKTADAIAQIRRHFEGIPAGPTPPAVITVEEPQMGERRLVLRRRGETNMLQMAFHSPAASHADIAPLLVLDSVLSAGTTSRLYQALVEGQLATSAWSDVGMQRDPSLFRLGATLKQGSDHAKVEAMLLEQVKAVQDTLITPAELVKAKNQAEASYVYESQGTSGLAHTLAQYEAIASWQRNFELLAQIKAVGPADVQRVAKTYLTADNRTVGWYVATPDGPVPPAPANSGNGKAVANAAKVQPVPLFPFELRRPQPGQLTPPVRKVLANGLRVLVLEVPASQTVAIDGYVHAGALADPPGKDGCAQAVAAMLDAGTARRNKLQLATDLETVSAGVDFSGGTATTGISGHCLAKDTTTTLATLVEMMREPAFPEAELSKLKSRWIAGIRQNEDQPGTRASRAFAQAIFPKGHPFYDLDAAEAIAQINAITPADLRAFHRRYYGPNATTLVVVGKVQARQVIADLERLFAGWGQAEAAPLEIPDVPAGPPKRIVVPMPDQTNVEIRFGHTAHIRRTSPDYYASSLANYILGGDPLTARLGLRLRDELGLTYGTYAGFAASLGAGPWKASITVNPANVPVATSELKGVIGSYLKSGATARELAFAKSSYIGSQAVGLASNSGMASSLSAIELYGLGLDHWARYPRLIDSVSLDQVNAAAKRLIHPESAHLILVGPLAPEAPAQ